MTTAIVAIEAAVVALLSSATPVATWIKSGDTRAMPKLQAEGVSVRIPAVALEPATIMGGQTLGDTTLVVELRHRGGLDLSAAAALDPLLISVNARLAGSATLGGLIGYMDLESLEYATEQGEEAAHTCLMTWRVTHQVTRTTLA